MASIRSAELWAASKVIGRECATVNKDFFTCRKQGNPNMPAPCEKEGDIATACAENVVHSLKTSFPTQFKAFQSCLDYNDYRMADCRETEKALLDCWNQKFVYKTEAPASASSSHVHH